MVAVLWDPKRRVFNTEMSSMFSQLDGYPVTEILENWVGSPHPYYTTWDFSHKGLFVNRSNSDGIPNLMLLCWLASWAKESVLIVLIRQQSQREGRKGPIKNTIVNFIENATHVMSYAWLQHCRCDFDERRRVGAHGGLFTDHPGRAHIRLELDRYRPRWDGRCGAHFPPHRHVHLRPTSQPSYPWPE